MSADESDVRLGLTFHRTFPLNLWAVSEILRLSLSNDGNISKAAIRQHTPLGTIYAEAMPRYARGCGLVSGAGKLTPLGETVCRHDPSLSHPVTLWLMHYHLSAPEGPGAAYWSNLVARCLPFYEDVRDTAMAAATARFLETEQPTESLKPETIKSAATAFRRTYVRSDGLGRLGLLQELKRRGSTYVYVREPQSPPPAAVAYALADYWATQPFSGQATVSLSELTRDDGFARLMWMDQRNLEETLDLLRQKRVLDIYRTAPPFQVTRPCSKEDLLPHLYD